MDSIIILYYSTSYLYRITTHDHLHNVKYSTYMRSAWWANQNIHLLYDLLARESMTLKITFTRYEKYEHVTTFGLHETPQQAFTKFRNFCSGSYLILYSLILSNFGSILPISVCFGLFRLIFYLFRFNRNTETCCFGIEAKQPKQKFCFG